MVGMVFHSPHKELSNLRIAQEETAAQGRNKFYALGGAMEAAEPDFKVIINTDGSMGIYPRSLHTLDTVLADRPDAAMALKAEIAANFYDLTTPVYDEINAGSPNYPNIPQEQKEDFDPVTQLLIPRVRRLNQPQSTVSDVVREVRAHDVTWYVRLLRNGWRASPDAIARAKELNVILAENETFVKAHTRGTRGEKALGYQAIRR